MADFLKNIVGGSKSSAAPEPSSSDSDFADFADAPSPAPVPFESVAGGGATLGGPAPTSVPYTKWYNVHERYSLNDFRAEGVILAIIAVIFTLHFIGTKLNRAKSRAWIKAHAPVLTSEFAAVGFGRTTEQDPEKLLKAKSLFEYATYATGRQNVAFMDVKLTLKKRFNPVMTFLETALSFFFDSFGAPEDSAEAILYPFDGKEAQIVPALPGAAELRSKDSKSTFDGFVWAIVNKDKMKQLREERYDLSITFTKDNSKLPIWATVMSESAEITETLLTNELALAIKKAGELFDYIIISDQPIDKPTKMDETIPRKRLYLRYRLPSSNNYDDLAPLLSYFVRISDHLASSAHFRPEVIRKVRAVRDENIRQIQKAAEEEKAEERQAERDRAKKAKRDAELNALDAKAQKKYLEREKEKELRKSSKKQTVRA
ncbi:DUF1682-domain-containing protein [Rostrohypoxylon terebratum]|nr:DUF1682-domain-containing protein [Rostrohypoxylon terebratum]